MQLRSNMTSLSDFRPEIFLADTCSALDTAGGSVERRGQITNIINSGDWQGLLRFWLCNPGVFQDAFVHAQCRLLGKNKKKSPLQCSINKKIISAMPSCAVFCPGCETWLVSPEHLYSHYRPDPLTSDDFASNRSYRQDVWCQVMKQDTLALLRNKNIASTVVIPELFNNSSDAANAAQVAFIIKLGHSPVRCPRCKVWLAHPWYIATHEQNPSRCYLARRAALVGVDKLPFKTNALIHVAGSVNGMTHAPRSRTLFRLVSRAVTRPKLLHRAHVVLNTIHLQELLQQHPNGTKLHSILIETGWIETIATLPANFQGTMGVTKLVRMHLKLMDAMPWLA